MANFIVFDRIMTLPDFLATDGVSEILFFEPPDLLTTSQTPGVISASGNGYDLILRGQFTYGPDGLNGGRWFSAEFFYNGMQLIDFSGFDLDIEAVVDATDIQLERMMSGGDDLIRVPRDWQAGFEYNAYAGNDRIEPGAGDDSITGGTGNDTVRIHSPIGEALVTGMFGEVQIASRAGRDWLFQVEVVEFDDRSVTIHTGGGLDSRIGGLPRPGADSAYLVGADGNDTLTGSDADDYLSGGPGDDSILGGGGLDMALFDLPLAAVEIRTAENGLTLVSALGSDFVAQDIETFRFADTQVGFGALAALAASVVTGTDAGELLNGTGRSDEIFGLGGADWIMPGTGSDAVDGGEGRDMVSFADLPDLPARTLAQYRIDLDLGAGLVRTPGDDTCTLVGVERVTGTVFADRMRGSSGDDELRGLGDYDWFIATEGRDTLNGGTGQDMVSFVEWGNPQGDVFDRNGVPPAWGEVTGVLVDLADSGQNTNLARGITLIDVERVTGTGRQDVFRGDSGQNDFRGLGDYDWFVGSEGGRERYFGGDGIDTMTYFNAPAGINASLRNGALVNGRETGRGTAGIAARDLYFEIENLVGSDHDDSLTGNRDPNALLGLGGDDLIFGFEGNDRIKGGAGDDVIDGGDGTDYALYDGVLADHSVTRTGAATATVVAPDGTDHLASVEFLVFADTTLRLGDLALE